MRYSMAQASVLGLLLLSVGACGGAASVIAAGASGFGPGPGDEATVADARGRYLTSQSEEEEGHDCSDFTGTVNELSQSQLPIDIRQDGDDLYLLVGDQTPSANPFHPTIQLYGSLESSGALSARGSFSLSQSGTQNGISGTISVSGSITLNATLAGDVLSGTFDVSITTTISGMGQSIKVPCETKVTFTANR